MALAVAKIASAPADTLPVKPPRVITEALPFAAEVDHLQGRGTFVGPCHTPFIVMLP